MHRTIPEYLDLDCPKPANIFLSDEPDEEEEDDEEHNGGEEDEDGDEGYSE